MEQKDCSTCAHWKNAGECHSLESKFCGSQTREDHTCGAWGSPEPAQPYHHYERTTLQKEADKIREEGRSFEALTDEISKYATPFGCDVLRNPYKGRLK